MRTSGSDPMAMRTVPLALLEQAQTAAIEVALQAGSTLTPYLTRQDEIQVEHKGDNPTDLVTALDRATEKRIRETLMTQFPQFG